MPSKSATKKEYNAYYKKYRKTEKWKAYKREHLRKWRKLNSKIYDNARDQVAKAKRNKIIKPELCKICGIKKVEAHHSDYTKPLQVEWLCRKHHREADVRDGTRKN